MLSNAQKPYLHSLPYIYVKPSCNCVEFAKNFPKRFWVDTDEGETGHRAVRIRDDGDSWIIVESNYKKCSLTIRRLYKDDPKIIKIYK